MAPPTRACLVHNPVANVSSMATGLCDTGPCSTSLQVGRQRPELHRLLDQLRIGDTLVVWKLDRLSRSLKDRLHILERVETAGARFRLLTEAIDTSGPAGRMLMQMLGSFAEFERAMVRERTRAGLKA